MVRKCAGGRSFRPTLETKGANVMHRIAVLGLRGSGQSVLLRILRRHPQVRVAYSGGSRDSVSGPSAADRNPPESIDSRYVDESELLIDPCPDAAEAANPSPTPRVLLVQHPIDWAIAMRRTGHASVSSLVDVWSRYYGTRDKQIARAETVVVRYEDLIGSPAATLGRLRARLNLPPFPGSHQIPRVLKAEIDRTRRALQAARSTRPDADFDLDPELLHPFNYSAPAARRNRADQLPSDRAGKPRRRTWPGLYSAAGQANEQCPRKNIERPLVRNRLTPARHQLHVPLRRPPAPGEPLRVGLLTPSLGLGGAERWMISLARHADSSRIRWVGTALTYAGQADPALTAEMARLMPVYSDGESDVRLGTRELEPIPSFPIPHSHLPIQTPSPVQHCPTTREAIAAVANRADVVLTWGSARAGSIARRYGCRTVFVSHCSFGAADCLATAVDSQIYLTAVSEAATATFPNELRPRVRILHNGIDEHRAVAKRPREEVRRAWGFKPHHRLVGYVGRASHEKNPLAAAQAVARLGGDYRAVYVGSGRHLDEVRTAALQIAGPNVLFVPPMEQIGDALAALDCFVLASPSEGFSLALAEAWYAGLPTVATRVGAIPELEAKHGKLTVPVPINPTPEELAKAVEQALSEANQETVERARQVVREHYTATAMAARWTDYLEEIVRGAPSPHAALHKAALCWPRSPFANRGRGPRETSTA